MEYPRLLSHVGACFDWSKIGEINLFRFAKIESNNMFSQVCVQEVVVIYSQSF